VQLSPVNTGEGTMAISWLLKVQLLVHFLYMTIIKNPAHIFLHAICYYGEEFLGIVKKQNKRQNAACRKNFIQQFLAAYIVLSQKFILKVLHFKAVLNFI